jgi:hypothetical protein
MCSDIERRHAPIPDGYIDIVRPRQDRAGSRAAVLDAEAREARPDISPAGKWI